MKKLKIMISPIAYNEEKKYTYITSEKKLFTLDRDLNVIDRSDFLSNMYKGILVCDNKVLVTASSDGKIASYDLINKKIISNPKNAIKYVSDEVLWYSEGNKLIFREGLGKEKPNMLYSYKVDEKGILTVENEVCLKDADSNDVIINYEILSIENERIYMIELSHKEKDNVSLLFYDINTRKKTYLSKESLDNHFYYIYDEKHIINQEGTKIINVFSKESKEVKIGKKSYRFFSKDKKYAILWEHKARKLHIKNTETYESIKVLEYRFFFKFYEFGEHVFILGDYLYAYTKEEFYEI